jgi:hypothetical protein
MPAMLALQGRNRNYLSVRLRKMVPLDDIHFSMVLSNSKMVDLLPSCHSGDDTFEKACCHEVKEPCTPVLYKV